MAAMFAVNVRRNRYLRGSLFKNALFRQPSFDERVSKIDLFHLLISRLVDEVKNKVLIRYDSLGSNFWV